MKILDRLPILEAGWFVPTPDGAEEVKPYQIIVTGQHRGSRGSSSFPTMRPDSRPSSIPGNNHNFAIRQGQFERWTPMILPRSGQVELGTFPSRSSAPTSGSTRTDRVRSTRAERPPFRLELQRGIAVYPPDVPNPARLPDPGPARPDPQPAPAHDRRRRPEFDPRIPFRLSPIAFHPTPATVTSGSRMRTLDKRVMDRRLHPWD